MEAPEVVKKQSHFVLIVVLCALFGGGLGFGLIQLNSNPTPTEIEYVVIERGTGNPLDTLKVTHRNQFLPQNELDKEKAAKKMETNNVANIDVTSTFYHQNVSFLGWTMLIIIMMSIAAAAAPIFAYEVRNLRDEFHLTKKNIWIGVILSFCFFIVAFTFSSIGKGLYTPDSFVEHMGVLLESGWVLVIIVIATLLFQFPIFMTVFLIPVAADRVGSIKNDRSAINEAARKFNQLESILRKSLHVMAVLVVFSVLTSSALGASTRDTIYIDGFDIFPPEISYTYGLLFSFFLAMIYVPSHYFIRFKSRSFMEGLYNETNDEETLEYLGKVKESVLIKQSALENLKIAFTVVAPLVSSFLPDFISLI